MKDDRFLRHTTTDDLFHITLKKNFAENLMDLNKEEQF